jgi:hypothetical protein
MHLRLLLLLLKVEVLDLLRQTVVLMSTLFILLLACAALVFFSNVFATLKRP